MVRMNRSIRSFWAAKTCSTLERIFDLTLLARRLFAMDAADKAVLFHELFVGLRAIRRVGPDPARRVGLVEKPFAQTRALVGGGVRRAPAADEAKLAIDRNVILISEDRNRQIDRRRRAIFSRLGFGELDRPARVAILLAEFRGLVLPCVWNAPFLDRLFLFHRVALAWRSDQAGVDDLARHGDVAGLAEDRVEAGKQSLNEVGAG